MINLEPLVRRTRSMVTVNYKKMIKDGLFPYLSKNEIYSWNYDYADEYLQIYGQVGSPIYNVDYLEGLGFKFNVDY